MYIYIYGKKKRKQHMIILKQDPRCMKVPMALPAVRQEFAGGMARPVATRDWTSVVQNANTTVTNTT